MARRDLLLGNGGMGEREWNGVLGKEEAARLPVAGREVIAYFIYMLGRLEASASLASMAM